MSADLWEFTVPAISKDERRDMAFGLLDELHDERKRLGLTSQKVADIIDSYASTVKGGHMRRFVNRLDIVCGLAYVVRKKLVLAPWDDTDS